MHCTLCFAGLRGNLTYLQRAKQALGLAFTGSYLSQAGAMECVCVCARAFVFACVHACLCFPGRACGSFGKGLIAISAVSRVKYGCAPIT